MQTRRVSLDQIHIPEPCHADWSTMSGDAAKRFCESCSKHVHDLSTMSRAAAEALIASGNVCVRLTLDPAGKPVTREVHRPWYRPTRWAAAASMLISAALTLAGCERANGMNRTSGMVAVPGTMPVRQQVLKGEVACVTTAGTPVRMGDVAVPASQPATQPADAPPVLKGKAVMRMGFAAPSTQPTTRPAEAPAAVQGEPAMLMGAVAPSTRPATR